MRALDLFAGTGWGVACQRLGIEEYGVENMPEAIATREAAGMRTAFHDVWEGLDPEKWAYIAERIKNENTGRALNDWARSGGTLQGFYELLIASPPCQTFSVAGKGAGRAALDDVLGAIQFGAYKSGEQLRALTDHLDDRTALVLTPLAYAYRDRPKFIVFEQVPTVLPVWEACAEVLREIDYSVTTSVLNAEQYGVPQTRRRAILFARRDGIEAVMPTPTHSRYHSRTPQRLDEGVQKWVSMAEALGWDTEGYLRSNYGTGGDASKRGERLLETPAPTMTSKADRNTWMFGRPSTTIVASDIVAGPGRSEFVKGGVSRQNRPGSLRVSAQEAATLQSYPDDFIWDVEYIDQKGRLKPITKGKQFLQIGNAVPPLLGHAILEPIAIALAQNTETEIAA